MCGDFLSRAVRLKEAFIIHTFTFTRIGFAVFQSTHDTLISESVSVTGHRRKKLSFTSLISDPKSRKKKKVVVVVVDFPDTSTSSN